MNVHIQVEYSEETILKFGVWHDIHWHWRKLN